MKLDELGEQWLNWRYVVIAAFVLGAIVGHAI